MISVIVPVFNEEKIIRKVLDDLECELIKFGKHEIIVVDDGSIDNTFGVISEIKNPNLVVLRHVENLGYGKSLIDGISQAKNECILIIDGDGSYPIDGIKDLYSHYPQYDMIVGARTGDEYRKGFLKRPARQLFAYLVRYACGRKVPDVNSGLRIFKRDIVLKFKPLLCTGFSFTTTLTLLFLLNHYFVKYVPIDYMKRDGSSKVNHVKDTLRAGQIVIQAIVRYNPIKLFLLLAFCNLSFGIVLGILNSLFFGSSFLAITAGICIASCVPIFALGLAIDRFDVTSR